MRASTIDVIVAPYEADAQLAYLAHNNLVDVVVTQDSDLVVFGCDTVSVFTFRLYCINISFFCF